MISFNQWFRPSQPVAPTPPTDAIAAYTYYVTQTVDNCSSPMAGIDVAVKTCCDGNIFIPTAFTPNGDGHNDVFEVLPDYGYFVYSLCIFNRWGQVIYLGSRARWDGRFGGAYAETGTYYYVLSLGCVLGGDVVRKGDVTLIR